MPINDASPRNRQWLFDYVRRPLADGARVRRYLRAVESWDSPLDLTDPGCDPSMAQQAYNVSRSGGALLGRKAFLYATRGTKRYGDPKLLAEVLGGLRTFADKQDDQGRFIWGDPSFYYPKGTHEHVWRLEPIIWARLWLDPHLTNAQRRGIDRTIRRAAPYLLKVPRIDNSNQGVIWCYGCWLVGLYLEDRRYIEAAERHADGIMNAVVDSQGQVIEASARYYRGGGPCSNYTYTGWTYVMLYRLITGKRAMDERMMEAMRWLALVCTRSGLPMAPGASVRMFKPRTAISDTLHGFEFYSDREPYFSKVIDDRYAEAIGNRAGHALHPCIWAAIAHAGPRKSTGTPVWRRDFERMYETPSCQYFIASHRYQTALTLRGLFPFNGIQSFAYGSEPPIIHPTRELASTVISGKVDIAAQNVDAGPKGWEVHHRRRGPGDADQNACRMTSVTTRRGEVWECCLFTAASVVYVVGGGRGATLARWVLNSAYPAEATLDTRRRRLTFAGRKAMIHYHADSARLTTHRGQPVFEVRAKRGTMVIGFGGDDLRFERHMPALQRLQFTDDTGKYQLGYRPILADDGTLRRWWGNIITYRSV